MHNTQTHTHHLALHQDTHLVDRHRERTHKQSSPLTESCLLQSVYNSLSAGGAGGRAHDRGRDAAHGAERSGVSTLQRGRLATDFKAARSAGPGEGGEGGDGVRRGVGAVPTAGWRAPVEPARWCCRRGVSGCWRNYAAPPGRLAGSARPLCFEPNQRSFAVRLVQFNRRLRKARSTLLSLLTAVVAGRTSCSARSGLRSACSTGGCIARPRRTA